MNRVYAGIAYPHKFFGLDETLRAIEDMVSTIMYLWNSYKLAS